MATEISENLISPAVESELTIASGAVTKTGKVHRIDTESDASTDDLVTINGGSEGDILILGLENASRVVTLKDATGNLFHIGHGDIVLDTTSKWVVYRHDGTAWRLFFKNFDVAGFEQLMFESSEISVATGANNYAGVAHGLGEVPKLVELRLRCKTSQYGYGVDEEAQASRQQSGISSHDYSCDATNVYFGQDGTPNVKRRDTTGHGAVTPANWRWVIRAWY
jgi:hypothetical protein